MRFHPLTIPSLLLAACSAPVEQKADVSGWADMEKQVQTELIMVEDGGTVTLPEGNYLFKGTLSVEGKRDVTIRGAGAGKTVFSFQGQADGAEGLRISNCERIVLEGLTLQDASGDIIKAQKVVGLTIRDVVAEWTGEPKETNGAYAFYPVDCDTVLMERCTAIGASDAGIYVGQSRDIIVRNCTATKNVAGIEIENCIRADVYDNHSHGNTGGILIFDMPDLTQSGSLVRVFNNRVIANNHRNFAPAGNIVGEVPPGTGVMVLATKHVEIFGNEITDNRTIGAVVVSYKLVRKTHSDANFDPYPKGVSIHDNRITKGAMTLPDLEYDLAKLLMVKFPVNRPDILFDGFLDPALESKDGNYTGNNRICVGDNNGARFAMVDAPNEFKNPVTDRSRYDCRNDAIGEVKLN